VLERGRLKLKDNKPMKEAVRRQALGFADRRDESAN
jgi:hypothetical protein